MLKKTISYKDADGNNRSREHWFHLTKAQILKLELLTPGGDFSKHLQTLAANVETEPAPLIALFEKLLHLAYGERQGSEFIKSQALSDKFTSTDAYSELFFELCTDAGKASEFVNGIMPVDIADQLQATAQSGRGGRPVPQDRKPKQLRVVEDVELPTDEDVENVFDNYESTPAPLDKDWAAQPMDDEKGSPELSEFEQFREWKRNNPDARPFGV